MLILAIESSHSPGGVAALRDGKGVVHVPLPAEATTTQSLCTTVEQVLRETGASPSEVEGLAVTQGPGSFTGLRIGLTFAKLFAYATSARLIACSTFEVLAWQAWQAYHRRPAEELIALGTAAEDPPQGNVPHVELLLDAQRQQLFTQRWTLPVDRVPTPAGPVRLVDQADWLAAAPQVDLFLGQGLQALQRRLERAQRRSSPETLPAEASAWASLQEHRADESWWTPSAATLAWQAAIQAREGRFVSAWELSPDYGRLSAAEEKAGSSRSAS